jgi:uncharacterized membrane protein
MTQPGSPPFVVLRLGVRQRVGDWFSIWKEIPGRLGDFLVWFFVAVLIGGLLPLVRVGLAVGWRQAVLGGSLASFCVILLSDSIATNVILQTRRTTKVLEEGKRVIAAFAIVLVVSQASLVAPSLLTTGTAPTNGTVTIQLAFTLVALLTAVHLHCFRLRDLEPTADEAQATEDASVDQLATGSTKLSKTKAGEAL